MDVRGNITLPLWLVVAGVALLVDACSDDDDNSSDSSPQDVTETNDSYSGDVYSGDVYITIDADGDSIADIPYIEDNNDVVYHDEGNEYIEDTLCASPLEIENILTNVSPFGNRAEISWETTRPALCRLLWEETPVDYTPQVIYETTAAIDHAMTVGERKQMLPGHNYDFYIACMETCPGWPLQVFSDPVAFETEELHLLVALSPKYADNREIDDALAIYGAAVALEGWTTDIERLNETTNDHAYIKDLLAERKYANNTLAAILVGEDLPFALFIPSSYYGTFPRPSKIILPSINEWVDTEEIGDPLMDNFGIAVSLVVPSPYVFGGSEHLVAETFLKFASDRERYDTEVKIFHDSTAATGLHHPGYPELDMLGDLTADDTPTRSELATLEGESMKFFYAGGHGSPYAVQLDSFLYDSTNIMQIDVPLAVVSGCFTDSWVGWERDGVLENFPRDNHYFGGLVLRNTPLHAIVTGIPTQGCEEEFCGGEIPPYWDAPLERWPNFISYSIPQLAEGKSLAEAIYGAEFFAQNVLVYGDITFRYHE